MCCCFKKLAVWHFWTELRRERGRQRWHRTVCRYLWENRFWRKMNGREMILLVMLCASCSSPSLLFTLPRPCGDWSPRKYSRQQEEFHTDPSRPGPLLANIRGYGPVYPHFPSPVFLTAFLLQQLPLQNIKCQETPAGLSCALFLLWRGDGNPSRLLIRGLLTLSPIQGWRESLWGKEIYVMSD